MPSSSPPAPSAAQLDRCENPRERRAWVRARLAHVALVGPLLASFSAREMRVATALDGLLTKTARSCEELPNDWTPERMLDILSPSRLSELALLLNPFSLAVPSLAQRFPRLATLRLTTQELPATVAATLTSLTQLQSLACSCGVLPSQLLPAVFTLTQVGEMRCGRRQQDGAHVVCRMRLAPTPAAPPPQISRPNRPSCNPTCSSLAWSLRVWACLQKLRSSRAWAACSTWSCTAMRRRRLHGRPPEDPWRSRCRRQQRCPPWRRLITASLEAWRCEGLPAVPATAPGQRWAPAPHKRSPASPAPCSWPALASAPPATASPLRRLGGLGPPAAAWRRCLSATLPTCSSRAAWGS